MTDFKLKQYEKLNNEISTTLAQIASIEKYSIIFSGSLIAWLISKHCSLPSFAFFIPVAMIALLGIVSYGMYKRIELIGEFIKKEYTESWEGYLSKNNSKVLINSRFVMWISHLVFTLAVAIYLMSRPM